MTLSVCIYVPYVMPYSMPLVCSFTMAAASKTLQAIWCGRLPRKEDAHQTRLTD